MMQHLTAKLNHTHPCVVHLMDCVTGPSERSGDSEEELSSKSGTPYSLESSNSESDSTMTPLSMTSNSDAEDDRLTAGDWSCKFTLESGCSFSMKVLLWPLCYNEDLERVCCMELTIIVDKVNKLEESCLQYITEHPGL